MKNNKPKYVLNKKLANGVIAYYFNMPARLIPEGLNVKQINTPLGTNKWKAYAEADKLDKYIKNFRVQKGFINKKSIRYLWTEYQQTKKYKESAERTLKQYNKSYKFLSIRKNSKNILLIDISLDLFDRKSVEKLIERFLETINIFDVKKHRDFIRKMYNFGIDEKIFRADKKILFQRLK